jgi:hypothetical protein
VTRSLPPLLAAVISLALALPTGAAAKAPKLSVVLPDAGHVTVQAVEVSATGQPARALPRRVKLRALKARSLSPSVRVLTATRVFRRHGRMVYAALIFAVNKAGAASAADASSDEPDLLDMVFDRRRTTCSHCLHTLTPGEYEMNGGMCNCQVRRARIRQAIAVNADAGARSSTLTDLFKSDFSKLGDPQPVFNEPSLDTGHYDDGHAFGWNVKTEPEVRKVEIDLVQDIIDGEQQKVVSDLEVAGAIDLNGDGHVGTQVGIIIGPPVIT